MKFKWEKKTEWVANHGGITSTVFSYGGGYVAEMARDSDGFMVFNVHKPSAKEAMEACEAESQRRLDKATDIFEGKK
jgi:hypothetical protein